MRQLFHKMVDVVPENRLGQLLQGLEAGGKKVQFKVGKIWATYDYDRQMLVDERGIQVAAGIDLAKVSEIDFDGGGITEGGPGHHIKAREDEPESERVAALKRK